MMNGPCPFIAAIALSIGFCCSIYFKLKEYLLTQIQIILNQNLSTDPVVFDVVDSCSPAIVTVLNKDPKAVYKSTGAPVYLYCGSGFIISEDGLIITNAHVVKHSIERPNLVIEVRLVDGFRYDAALERIDFKLDIAILRINEKNLPVIKLGESNNLIVGEFVVAMGSSVVLYNPINIGVINSFNKTNKKQKFFDDIETNIPIFPGNSGGPLININREVIGIISKSVNNARISYAIPIDYAKKVLKKNKGRVTPSKKCEYEEERKRDQGNKNLNPLPERFISSSDLAIIAFPFIKLVVLSCISVRESEVDLIFMILDCCFLFVQSLKRIYYLLS